LALVQERLAAAFRGDVQRLEVPLIRADGSHGIAALLYAPVREGSAITRVLILARDVTDQRRSESQYQQAEKLAALGQGVSTVALDLDPGEPKIWADGSELQQLLLNLLINAEQALVTVDPPRTIAVRSRADERDARLEIADSGPGIPTELRTRIFDPFFTTKP